MSGTRQLSSTAGGEPEKTAPTGRAENKVLLPGSNPAKTRPKGWAKPLKQGPHGQRFLEFVNLEPGSLSAAMVHWLLRKKVLGAQYSVRELADRFSISTKIASQFLHRAGERGWGWVEWCEGVVETGNTLVGMQYLRHEVVTSPSQPELTTTDRMHGAC